jgi:hypothetical protein
MIALVLAALTGAAPPSPLQYYSQALATMQRVPVPAYVSFDTSVTARGLGMATPCDKGKIQWDFAVRSGYRGQLYHELTWHALYASANEHEVIRTVTGDTCRGRAETFDRPTWQTARLRR